jgi:hypothetical protein
MFRFFVFSPTSLEDKINLNRYLKKTIYYIDFKQFLNEIISSNRFRNNRFCWDNDDTTSQNSTNTTIEHRKSEKNHKINIDLNKIVLQQEFCGVNML